MKINNIDTLIEKFLRHHISGRVGVIVRMGFRVPGEQGGSFFSYEGMG